MTTQNQNIVTGNNIDIAMDGKIVGLLQNLEANDDLGLDAASGIGQAEAVEMCPGMARYSLSASRLVLRADAFADQGLLKTDAASALKGLVFDVIATDKLSGKVLYKYTKVSVATGSTSIVKHQIVSSNVTLMACHKV